MVVTTETGGAQSVPPAYQALVEVWGPAIGVEEARTRWGELVALAEAGTVTLIARDPAGSYDWTALVPLTEVAEPPEHCPVWASSEARPKLGEVVAGAAPFGARVTGSPQILTRHRRPVAAVIAAIVLANRPNAVDRLGRLSIEELLEAGGRVVLSHYPGDSGAVDEEGDLIREPEAPGFVATAEDHAGAVLGEGFGDTVGEALLRLHRTGTPDYAVPSSWYSSEPPLPVTPRPPDADPWPGFANPWRTDEPPF